jgi:hypothetical protein
MGRKYLLLWKSAVNDLKLFFRVHYSGNIYPALKNCGIFSEKYLLNCRVELRYRCESAYGRMLCLNGTENEYI